MRSLPRNVVQLDEPFSYERPGRRSMDCLGFGCTQAIGGDLSVPRDQVVSRVCSISHSIAFVWILRATAVRLTAAVIIDNRPFGTLTPVPPFSLGS